jgi:mono/diheme cytochrome c family protein
MRLCGLGFALLIPILAGCGPQQSAGVGASGYDIYMARCAVCHGENREGRPGMYPPLAGSAWVDGPVTRFAPIVLNGLQGRVGNYNAVMPGWGATLNDTDIASVMTWLRAEDGKAAVTAVDVNHARILAGSRNDFWTVEDLSHIPAQ